MRLLNVVAAVVIGALSTTAMAQMTNSMGGMAPASPNTGIGDNHATMPMHHMAKPMHHDAKPKMTMNMCRKMSHSRMMRNSQCKMMMHHSMMKKQAM